MPARTVATPQANQEAVIKGGGIEPLVRLLSSGTTAEAMTEAADALWSLSCSGVMAQTTIVEAGAIPALIKLVEDESSPRAQLKAAGAISGITVLHAANQELVMRANAVSSLVRMLEPVRNVDLMLTESTLPAMRHREEGQANAASALAELARDNPTNQSIIAEAGCIETLIELLEQGGLAAKDAAATLWRISSGHRANQTAIAQAGGIAPLVALLGSDSVESQKQAAGALVAISADNHENEEAIALMLVDLLSGVGAPEKAARAISRLARANISNQNAVARAGGIPLLVKLLEEAGQATLRLAAEAPEASEEGLHDKAVVDRRNSGTESTDDRDSDSRSVASMASCPSDVMAARSQRVRDIAAAQKDIAGAIWSMAHDNAENQVTIAASGGVPPLIEMLTGASTGYRDAAGALWALAANAANQQTIAEMGGIAPLVAILIGRTRGHMEAHETAAGAISMLAKAPELRTKLADAGAISPLVELFNVRAARDTYLTAGGTLGALTLARPLLASAAGGQHGGQGAVCGGTFDPRPAQRGQPALDSVRPRSRPDPRL